MALASASAADDQRVSDSEWNHFGLDFRVGFNLKARFGNIGASAPQSLPPSSGGLDHNYADGFVRVDSSGNRGGLTWNWGYQNASQVSGKDTLLMHVVTPEGGASDAADEPRLGVEAHYARDLGHFSSGSWGLKLALGYTDVKIHQSQPVSGTADLVTDAYSLGGITPPAAPYAGSFSGPGPLIGDTPARSLSSVPGGALTVGSRQLDIWLYDLKIGPYLELPLVRPITFQVGAGFAGGLVDSTFSFSENTTTSLGAVQAEGSTQRTDALAGFYAEAGLTCRVLSKTSLFAGGQFEYLGRFNQTAATRTVELDLRRSVFLLVGLQWDF